VVASSSDRRAGYSTMSLRQLLPGSISVTEGWVDNLQSVLSLPERCLIEKAVPKRKREFTAGRTCARGALAGLGVAGGSILAGRRGQPLWPLGVRGSITHTDWYCGAAAARTVDFIAIGIDAELHTPLDGAVMNVICTEKEKGWCGQGHPGIHRAKLLFCVKEGLFKAAYPILGMDPGYLNVEVTVDLNARSFRLSAAKSGERELARLLEATQGTFELYANHILVAVWVPAGRSF
jgi:4'-phosphopantetheinyl transferase EntD